MMPVAEFPGALRLGLRRRRPVRADAPLRHAGRPARASSTAPTRSGLGVILDVVYNHFGPDGNYLGAVLRRLLHANARERVGRALNFDGPDSGPVREFFVANAALLDRRVPLRRPAPRRHAGHLRRLDRRTSSPSIGAPRARGRAAARSIVLVAENEPQDTQAGPARRRRAATGSTRSGTTTSTTARVVALTGRSEAYYTDYRGTPQELVSAAKWGYLFQGQHYPWQKQRARHAGARPRRRAAFVTFLENHDQVANSAAASGCTS